MADAVTDRTKLIFVCNPNNPTGTSVGAKEFDAFMERVPEDVVVMIDECYWEFAERSDFPDSLAWMRLHLRRGAPHDHGASCECATEDC